MAKIYWTYNYVDSRRNLLDELDSFKYLIFHSITNDTKVAHDNASLQWLGRKQAERRSQEKRWILLSEIASRVHGSLSHWQSGNSLVAWWPFCIALWGWQVLWNDEDAWLATHTHTLRKRETKQACCSDNKSSEIVTERQSYKHTHTHMCAARPEYECSCTTSWRILGSCICCFV